jgi:hypothetical protein
MRKAGPRSAPILFGRDRGIAFFLGFLALTTMILPAVTLSQLGRLGVSLAFALMLIFGAFATIRHRAAIYLVIGLTIAGAAAAGGPDTRLSPRPALPESFFEKGGN